MARSSLFPPTASFAWTNSWDFKFYSKSSCSISNWKIYFDLKVNPSIIWFWSSSRFSISTFEGFYFKELYSALFWASIIWRFNTCLSRKSSSAVTHKFFHFWLDIDSANIQTYCVLSINDCILNLIPTAQTSKHWRCPYFFAAVFGFVNLSSHSIWSCSSSDVVQGLVFIELTPRCPCQEPRLFHFGYVKFSIFIYLVKFAW